MRLFAAVELSDEVREAAARTADAVRRKLGRAIDARWVEPAKMHLTVRFIGHVDDEQVPRVVDVLSAPVRVRPFDAALGGCGVFPSSGAARVIWIGLSDGMASLAALHDEFNRRLAPLGFESDDRPFSAHLTLARVKDVRTGPPAALRETVGGVIVPSVRCRIERATIFRSHMSSKGSRYEALAHPPLS